MISVSNYVLKTTKKSKKLSQMRQADFTCFKLKNLPTLFCPQRSFQISILTQKESYFYILKKVNKTITFLTQFFKNLIKFTLYLYVVVLPPFVYIMFIFPAVCLVFPRKCVTGVYNVMYCALNVMYSFFISLSVSSWQTSSRMSTT